MTFTIFHKIAFYGAVSMMCILIPSIGFAQIETNIPKGLGEAIAAQQKDRTLKNFVDELPDQLDASVVMPDGMAYFFHDKKYSMFDIFRNKKAQTVRLDRSSTFQKKLPANLDAGFIHPINKKAYFFKGDKYYRYDFFKKKIEKVGTVGVDGWKGISGKIDAVFSHPTQNAAYFFQEEQFHKYSFSKRKFVEHGKIGLDQWRGVPQYLEAAMMHSNGMAYFFKGDQYYRFDFNTKRMNKQATVGKSGWKGLTFAPDTSANKNIKLKITLTRIHPHQTEDNDNIGDYEIHQSIKYLADKVDKKPIDRNVHILSKEPVMFYEGSDGQRYKKPIGTFLITSGHYSTQRGQPSIQLHLYEGQTKTINNSVTFNITPKEARDRGAGFEILTSMSELDDCGKEWYKPGLYDANSCDYYWVAKRKTTRIEIYEVLKYLKKPSDFGPYYFGAQGGYHKFSGDSNVMKFRDDSNGALEGKIVLRTNSNDEKHDFWIRLELIK